MTVLTLFVCLMALGSFASLGLGQMMWQKAELQRIADLAATTAASQLGNGPTFTEAYAVALKNGAQRSEVSLSCRTSTSAATTCDVATRARAEVTRTVTPFFFGASRAITAIAEVATTPLVAGSIRSGLLALDTNQSLLLNALVNTIGGGSGISLSLASWQGLLDAGLGLNLLDLTVRLGAASLTDLLNLQVGLGDLLVAVVDVANGATKNTAVVAVNQLRIPLNSTTIRVADLLGVGLANSDAAKVNLKVADIGLTAMLAGVQGRAVNLGLNTGGLGITLKLYVVEPPQLLIGKRREGAAYVAYAKTAQIKIELNSKGLSVPVGVPGLLSVNVSSLDMSLYLQVGGGDVTVRDVQCKIPRSDNVTQLEARSSLLTLCVSSAPSHFADINTVPIVCGPPANILVVDLVVLFIPIHIGVKAGAFASADSNTAYRTLVGAAPQSVHMDWSAAQGLVNLVTGLNLNLQFDLSLAGLDLSLLNTLLSGLLTPILQFVVTLLAPVLAVVGGLLDSVLNLLGVSLSAVDIDLNSINCSSTLLVK